MAKWTKEAIREKIMADDKWLIRGLLAIYRLQTDAEQNAGQTMVSASTASTLPFSRIWLNSTLPATSSPLDRLLLSAIR